MHILLVQPNYYTRYPPLGLLKLASYHKSLGDTVEYVRGEKSDAQKPDLIFITSLFSYAWRPVHDAVHYYRSLFPNVKIILGGIYASLLPEHAKSSGADEVHVGLFEPAEDMLPDYSLVPKWDASIIFSSRGCIRKCSFCAVPLLEGNINSVKYSIKHLIYPSHKRIILWDNNILGCPNWKTIFDELLEINRKVDFNQGLDARLLTNKVAEKLAKLRYDVIRLAHDNCNMSGQVEKAIQRLKEVGVKGRDISVYTLFNYNDDPEDFFRRVRDILDWGAVSYPMRYEPLCSLQKNAYVAPKWTSEEIEMVQESRRVIGYGGAFPPYEGLVKKFDRTRSFYEAFTLRKEKDETVLKLSLHEMTHKPMEIVVQG
jgi:hypothetical protein